MISTEPARPTLYRARIRRRRIALLLLVATAVAVVPAHLPADLHRGVPRASVVERANGGERGGPLGEADGAVPDGTTVFDDGVPGVARLDAALLGALRRAATDAASAGVELHVDSGWRSPAYQEHLREDAVAKYGSDAEAARWVATPATSPHVSGDAVDIGPPGAAAWLAEHGAAYGLCRVYANEPWHFELRAGAAGRGCPAPYADPTEDPRMQR